MIKYLLIKIGKIKFLRALLNPIRQLLVVKPRLAKMNKAFNAHSMTVFTETCKLLISNNIQFWPEFGTLLGICRDGDFIKHDFDFDFGIYTHDCETVKEVLSRAGFIIVHEYEGINHPEIREITLSYLGVNVDFFCFNIHPKDVRCYLFAHHDINIKGECFYKIKEFKFPHFNLKDIYFKGIKVTIPSDWDAHLKVSYGEKYMIPDPNFKSLHTTYLKDIYAKGVDY